MEKTEKMKAAEKAFNVEYTNATECADELIDKYYEEEMTKEEVIKAAEKIGGEVEKIVKKFL